MRFNAAGFHQDEAIKTTQRLFGAARLAGVRRVVHISITNPSLESPYSYFAGKAQLEEDLQDTGSPATGRRRLSEWARAEANHLGKRYANELRVTEIA